MAVEIEAVKKVTGNEEVEKVTGGVLVEEIGDVFGKMANASGE